MICQECEDEVEVLREDPRDPPLDTERCLCIDCYQVAVEDVIADAEDIIEELQDHIVNLKAIPREDQISRKELKELVRECPIGYNGKKLIMGRWSTEADFIEWFGKLQKLAGIE